MHLLGLGTPHPTPSVLSAFEKHSHLLWEGKTFEEVETTLICGSKDKHVKKKIQLENGAGFRKWQEKGVLWGYSITSQG